MQLQMLRTLVVSWEPTVLSCCCPSFCSLYLPCESACWSSDVIANTLMLTAACVSLQGADCGGIFSLLPPPRSQPRLTFPSTTTSCLHLWLPVMIGFDIPTNPEGCSAGHCPFFSCRRAHKNKSKHLCKSIHDVPPRWTVRALASVPLTLTWHWSPIKPADWIIYKIISKKKKCSMVISSNN